MVLVTGATGSIGPAVVRALHASGHRVRALSRTAAEDGLFPRDVENKIGDVEDPEAVGLAARDVEAVIHLAGLLHIVNPPRSMNELYERINVKGTANVVNAALRARAKRVVMSSTIAVYGYGSGQILTEDSSPKPDTPYARTKLAAEHIVLSARREDGQPLGTVLRLGAVYGSRIKGNYRRLLLALARGRFVNVGDGQNRRTLVHDSDVGEAAVLAMKCPDAAGRVYNVSDGKFHTLSEIVSTMCDLLGRARPRISLPVRPVRFSAGLLEDVQRLAGLQPRIGRRTIDKFTEDVAVDSQRIQSELGFTPRVDLVSGWKQAIAEMKKSGEL
jgi:UDP-glucose 4-epimerase